jgi:hypothetical protein
VSVSNVTLFPIECTSFENNPMGLGQNIENIGCPLGHRQLLLHMTDSLQRALLVYLVILDGVQIFYLHGQRDELHFLG